VYVVVGENDSTHKPANLHENHHNHHRSFRSTEPRKPKPNLQNHRSGIGVDRRRTPIDAEISHQHPSPVLTAPNRSSTSTTISKNEKTNTIARGSQNQSKKTKKDYFELW
jgi:hypothetical protein